MSNHTAGPWAQNANRPFDVEGPDGQVCMCEFKMDARFIATAPDMLIELKQCATELEEAANLLSRSLPGMASIYRIAAKRVRRSIEHAEGSSLTSTIGIEK